MVPERSIAILDGYYKRAAVAGPPSLPNTPFPASVVMICASIKPGRNISKNSILFIDASYIIKVLIYLIPSTFFPCCGFYRAFVAINMLRPGGGICSTEAK